MSVSVSVENTGSMDGEEVVQIYLRDMEPEGATPLKKLVGFQRIFIGAGKSVRVAFQIKAEDFSHYDEEEAALVVNPGDFEIQAGASSMDIRLKGVVSLR